MGKGMQYGKLAGMRCQSVAKKWPISCVSKIANTQAI